MVYQFRRHWAVLQQCYKSQPESLQSYAKQIVCQTTIVAMDRYIDFTRSSIMSAPLRGLCRCDACIPPQFRETCRCQQCVLLLQERQPCRCDQCILPYPSAPPYRTLENQTPPSYDEAMQSNGLTTGGCSRSPNQQEQKNDFKQNRINLYKWVLSFKRQS